MQVTSEDHRKATEAFLNDLIEKYKADPESVSEADRGLVGKLVDSQMKAQMIAGRIDQFKKQAEMLTQQIRVSESDLQQEVGKASGLVDAILTVSKDSPAKEPPLPPTPPPNRKTRRAAAAKGRKGNNAGKPQAKELPADHQPEETA